MAFSSQVLCVKILVIIGKFDVPWLSLAELDVGGKIWEWNFGFVLHISERFNQLVQRFMIYKVLQPFLSIDYVDQIEVLISKNDQHLIQIFFLFNIGRLGLFIAS